MQNPGQRYCPPAEVSKSCCRKIRKSNEIPNIPRYYYSFLECEGQEAVKPRLVAQMDTERSIIYQKNCLGYDYEKPIQVRFPAIFNMVHCFGTSKPEKLIHFEILAD